MLQVTPCRVLSSNHSMDLLQQIQTKSLPQAPNIIPNKSKPELKKIFFSLHKYISTVKVNHININALTTSKREQTLHRRKSPNNQTRAPISYKHPAPQQSQYKTNNPTNHTQNQQNLKPYRTNDATPDRFIMLLPARVIPFKKCISVCYNI